MTGCIYFDITDIVRYAVSNDRVSGIQRVQFNLVAHLSRQHGGDVIRCVFHHSDAMGMVELDPAQLFGTNEYESSALLQQLGLEKPRKFFPSRSKVKSFLRPYNSNKLWRALRKLDVFASALFMPRRLQALGLYRQQVSYPEVPLTKIERLPDGAHYVLLSINTTNERVVRFAREHVQRGEDIVQVVYDLIPHVCPQFFSVGAVGTYRAWLEELVRQAPRVICISEWTARDLRQFVGPSAANWDIRAIPLAHEFDGFERNADVSVSSAQAAKLPDVPFVLCVGTLEVRKNGVTLLRAWRQVVADRAESAPLLVFAGKQGWLINEFHRLLKASPEVARRVLIVDSPSDRELAWLYQHCLFTVYPSFYEGWGLPVGESAWFGKYCIASRTSSIPEVCGDLIDYIDPDDASGIARTITRALADPIYVQQRECAIRDARLRSWGDVADSIFREVTMLRGTGPGRVSL